MRCRMQVIISILTRVPGLKIEKWRYLGRIPMNIRLLNMNKVAQFAIIEIIMPR